MKGAGEVGEGVGATHLFTRYRTLGGVETLLRRHLARDTSAGIKSRVVAFFEPAGILQGDGDGRVTGLGCTWSTTMAGLRARWRSVGPSTNGTVCVYHNGWGARMVADLDGAVRRVSLHHSDWPGVEEYLRAQTGVFDGMLCIGAGVLNQVRACLPELDGERTELLPLPISPPDRERAERVRRPGDPVVLGVSGRVVREQKRVDRIPAFLGELQRRGIPYRLEILGDGADRAWLESELRGKPSVVFHGRRSGAEYWSVLDGWDAIVFFSDYEGLPLALLEAMSRGLAPVYPGIASGGDAYVERVNGGCLYRAGEVGGAAEVVARMARWEASEWRGVSERARREAAPHVGDGYERTYAGFLRRLLERPRISRAGRDAEGRFGAAGVIPFGMLRRMSPHGWPRKGWV